MFQLFLDDDHAINFPFDSWKARQTILCVSVPWWYDYIIRKKQCGQVSLRSHVVWSGPGVAVCGSVWQGQLFFSHTNLPAAHTLAVSGCNTLLEHCVTLCHQRQHNTTQVYHNQLAKCAHPSASVTPRKRRPGIWESKSTRSWDHQTPAST